MGMRKIHYGWVICVTCTLLLFVTMGTVSNGFSIYLPYIMAERGLTHAQTSSLVTLRCLVAFVAMLLIGGYYRKVSLRVGTGLAVCCAGLAFWLYSAAETYPLFCVGAAVSGISYGLGSMIPVSILINRWFDQHRALALSICASGSGYVPSCSIGFCVASTKNGSLSLRDTPITVTVCSCIASRSADCVFGVARLISSARIMLLKIGPG